MPTLNRAGLVGCFVATAAGSVLLAGPAVTADRGGNDNAGTATATGAAGGSNPAAGTISARVGVRYDRPRSRSATAGAGGRAGAGAGSLTPVGDWQPPPCWYQPTYTAGQMKATAEKVWAQTWPSREWKERQRDYFVRGRPYTDFNLAKAGQGYFWSGYSPVSHYGDAQASSCTDDPFWVDKGGPAPAGHTNAVTPAVLSELAYEEIRIPQGRARTAPGEVQTVNLPTWVWLDDATFRPVSVTAYLPEYGISATTTARPIGMHLDPGTPDARLHPASGYCPLHGHRIGTPYTRGARGVPPCGVTYLRATRDRGPALRLTATVTWEVTWSGTGQRTPRTLPSGTFETSRDITVREIQTVNR